MTKRIHARTKHDDEASMTTQPDAGRKRRFPLIPIVLCIWLAMYLWMMHTAKWPWVNERAPTPTTKVLSFGSVPSPVLARFGSAVPARMHQGDWHRVFSGAALHESLLGLLLLGWWWSSLVRRLRGITGQGAVVLAMVAGGAIGNGVHAAVYPASTIAGPGPFGWVAALVGLQLGLGLFGRLAGGRALVVSALMSVLFIAAITYAFGGNRAWNEPTVRPMLGVQALGTSLGIGALLPLVLGARRVARAATGFAKPLAVVAALAWIGAFAVQMPKTVRAGQGPAVQSFLKALWETEVLAQQVYEEGRQARAFQRMQLHEALRAVAGHDHAKALEDRTTLDAYLEAMRAIARDDMRDPHGVLVRCRRALRTWHDTVEHPMRRAFGLSPRPPHRLRLWGES